MAVIAVNGVIELALDPVLRKTIKQNQKYTHCAESLGLRRHSRF